jgi:integrase
VARLINRLTPRFVMNAKPKGKPSPSGRLVTRYPDGGGLYLVCSASTDDLVNRSWSFKYEIGGSRRERRKGRRRELGLGPLYDVPLARAREEAAALRDMLRKGIDPLDAKQARKRALDAERGRMVTFRQDAESYMALHETGWSDKHAAQWRGSLARYVYPAIGNLPVSEIMPATLLQIIEPLWLKRTVTAARLVNRIENVLAYSTTHDHRQGDNPAGNLLAALPKQSKVTSVENFAAVPYAEVAEVMARLREINTISACALRFLILCAARTAEVLGATFEEIDFAAKCWTVPSARMKARRPHRVALSSDALELLRALPGHHGATERIFPLDPHALRRVLAKVRTGVSVHGFRASLKSWATEQTGFPRAVVESALAHRLAGNATEGAYLRDADLLEKRRKLMQAWAQYCATPTSAGDTVIPMRRASVDA